MGPFPGRDILSTCCRAWDDRMSLLTGDARPPVRWWLLTGVLSERFQGTEGARITSNHLAQKQFVTV